MQNSIHLCPSGQKKKSMKTNNSTLNNNKPIESTLDALPKQFVDSMRTLFDILDDRGTGFVKLIDIETGWQDDGSKGLPCGVIDSLRKVTPANGMLTFERFCAGLKISLLRNQINHHQQKKQSPPQLPQKQHQVQQQQIHPNLLNNNNINNNNNNNEKIRRFSTDNIVKGHELLYQSTNHQPIRPPSAPLLDIDNPKPLNQWNNMATVRPNNANATLKSQQRTLSLPQLSPDSDLDLMLESDSMDLRHLHQRSVNIYGTTSPPPPKPPRTGILNTHNVGIQNSANITNNFTNNGIDKAEIRHALQNWQMGVLMNEMDVKEKNKIYSISNTHYNNNNNHNTNNSNLTIPLRGTADGGSIDMTNNLFHNNKNNNNKNINKSLINKRREPRRHTLQNGIDYNYLKRLKQFEDERNVYLQGLEAVDKAREWYIQQLTNIQEKIRYLGRMGSNVVQWSEVHQERLDFQRARVLEINRHLSTLADIPVHMNLALQSKFYEPHKNQQIFIDCFSQQQPNQHQQQMQQQQQQQQQQQLQQSQPANRHLIENNKKLSDRIAMFDSDNQILKRNPTNRGAIKVQMVGHANKLPANF